MPSDTLQFWADDARSKRAVILPADDGGTGDVTIVLLHSLAGRETQWEAVLEHLRPSRRALALTLRGHLGAPSGGDFTVPVLAADVLRTVSMRGVERFIAVAHSAGASVAIQCAAAYPERVLGLCLVDAGGDARQVPSEEAEAFLVALSSESYEETIEASFTALLTGARPAVRDAVMRDLRATPQETVPAMLRALREFDPIIPLQRYPGPILAVTTSLSDSPFALHELVPKIRHVRIEGTSHWLHMDKPDEFNLLLDEFIAEVKSSSGLTE
jgi:pimeloyl-ACP methyl ester carboxylesterase